MPWLDLVVVLPDKLAAAASEAKKAEAASSATSGGLGAALDLIRSGKFALKQRASEPTPLRRQPSQSEGKSMAEVLRRRLEERKLAMGGGDEEEDDDDDWR